MKILSKLKETDATDWLWWLGGLPFAVFVLVKLGIWGVALQILYILAFIGMMLAIGYLLVRLPEWLRRRSK
jgi:hypothetical protein